MHFGFIGAVVGLSGHEVGLKENCRAYQFTMTCALVQCKIWMITHHIYLFVTYPSPLSATLLSVTLEYL